MASYNHFVTDPYAVLTIQLTMLFIYSGLVLATIQQHKDFPLKKY